MHPNLLRHTAPAIEPITLAEAKVHCKISVDAASAALYTTEDTDVTRMITMAREFAEEHGLHALITQTWDAYYPGFPAESFIRLPYPPLKSVTSISYTDTDGDAAAFTDFTARPHSNSIQKNYGVEWPEIYPESEVVIRFVCGFGDTAASVPAKIKGAMLLLVGHLYANREATIGGNKIEVGLLPLGVEALLSEYRMREVRF